MDKDYDLTILEASLRLGVSMSTIRRMIKRGQLTRIYDQGKRGKIIKLSSEEVDQLVIQRGRVATLPNHLSAQLIKAGKYEAIKRELDELKTKYEALLFRYGASESRNRELEARSSWWDRFKGWLRR